MTSDKRYKIAILICYIGKLPWYFEYFAHSCRFNHSIDFIIITDDRAYSRPLPKNLKLVFRTLAEINASATSKLGIVTNIHTGYKLCDFKPTYGILFEDLLREYDFWGHGDIDVIFGNIRRFITHEMLDQNDLISVRHDFLTGQFLLFRNTLQMNTLFTLSKDHQVVLESDRHFCFDETNFRWDEFSEGKPYHQIHSDIESMTHVVKRLQASGAIRAHFDFLVVEGLPGRIRWHKGRLFFKNQFEAILYHLVLFKKVYTPNRQIRRIPDSFTISPTRIYHN